MEIRFLRTVETIIRTYHPGDRLTVPDPAPDGILAMLRDGKVSVVRQPSVEQAVTVAPGVQTARATRKKRRRRQRAKAVAG